MELEKKAKRKNRYVVSKKVLEEFGIEKDYVPDIMKSTLPNGFRWVDHVGNNLKSPLVQKENHKLNFLNKIRNDIDA